MKWSESSEPGECFPHTSVPQKPGHTHQAWSKASLGRTGGKTFEMEPFFSESSSTERALGDCGNNMIRPQASTTKGSLAGKRSCGLSKGAVNRGEPTDLHVWCKQVHHSNMGMALLSALESSCWQHGGNAERMQKNNGCSGTASK